MAIGRQSAWVFGGSDRSRVLPGLLRVNACGAGLIRPVAQLSGAAWCHISRSCLTHSIIRAPRMPSPDRCGYPRATRHLFAHQGSVLIFGFGEALRFRNSPHISACLGSVARGAQGLQEGWIIRVAILVPKRQRRVVIKFREVRAKQASAPGAGAPLPFDNRLPNPPGNGMARGAKGMGFPANKPWLASHGWPGPAAGTFVAGLGGCRGPFLVLFSRSARCLDGDTDRLVPSSPAMRGKPSSSLGCSSTDRSAPSLSGAAC